MAALWQEPVCLVQAEGVIHQVVPVTFSELLVLVFLPAPCRRQCHELGFLSALAAASTTTTSSSPFVLQLFGLVFLGFFLCPDFFLSGLVLQCLCSLLGAVLFASPNFSGALVSCISLQGLLIFNLYLSRDEGLE